MAYKEAVVSPAVLTKGRAFSPCPPPQLAAAGSFSMVFPAALLLRRTPESCGCQPDHRSERAALRGPFSCLALRCRRCESRCLPLPFRPFGDAQAAGGAGGGQRYTPLEQLDQRVEETDGGEAAALNGKAAGPHSLSSPIPSAPSLATICSLFLSPLTSPICSILSSHVCSLLYPLPSLPSLLYIPSRVTCDSLPCSQQAAGVAAAGAACWSER